MMFALVGLKTLKFLNKIKLVNFLVRIDNQLKTFEDFFTDLKVSI
jgi:hypothetical protein